MAFARTLVRIKKHVRTWIRVTARSYFKNQCLPRDGAVKASYCPSKSFHAEAIQQPHCC